MHVPMVIIVKAVFISTRVTQMTLLAVSVTWPGNKYWPRIQNNSASLYFLQTTMLSNEFGRFIFVWSYEFAQLDHHKKGRFRSNKLHYYNTRPPAPIRWRLISMRAKLSVIDIQVATALISSFSILRVIIYQLFSIFGILFYYAIELLVGWSLRGWSVVSEDELITGFEPVNTWRAVNQRFSRNAT